MNSSFLIALLGLFALTACDHHDYQYYANRPNLLIGTWYFTHTDYYNISTARCCIPTGIITISPDIANSSHLLMKSTAWNGTVCDALLIDSHSTMILPFGNGSTYHENLTQSVYNQRVIDFSFDDLRIGNFTPANSSDFISVDLTMDFFRAYCPSCYNFELSGESCSFHISKAPSKNSEEVLTA